MPFLREQCVCSSTCMVPFEVLFMRLGLHWIDYSAVLIKIDVWGPTWYLAPHDVLLNDLICEDARAVCLPCQWRMCSEEQVFTKMCSEEQVFTKIPFITFLVMSTYNMHLTGGITYIRTWVFVVYYFTLHWPVGVFLQRNVACGFPLYASLLLKKELQGSWWPCNSHYARDGSHV